MLHVNIFLEHFAFVSKVKIKLTSLLVLLILLMEDAHASSMYLHFTGAL